MLFPALLLFLPAITYATHLLLTIPASPSLPNPSLLPFSTTALLTTLSSSYTTPLRTDNTFPFQNLSAGSYLLDVRCSTMVFAPLRVDVHALQGKDGKDGEVEIWGTFRGNEWGNKGEKVEVREVDVGGGRKAWGADVRVLGDKNYFVERVGFSPRSLLRNPMILIAVFTLGIVFGMPYLMDNMDPDLKAEFENRQKSGPLGGGQATANPLQNFDAAAWLAGSSSSKTEKEKKGEMGVGGLGGERGVTR